MSGPKVSVYTLTAEQRANMNAQQKCDNGILACIETIRMLQNQVSLSMGSMQIYDNCGNDESIALTKSLKEKIEEIESLEKSLSEQFDPLSGYQRPLKITISDEELRRKRAILDKLTKIKGELARLLKEIELCGTQSQALKEQIATEIQENLGSFFGLSWDTPETTPTPSIKDDIVSALSNLLSNSSLSSEHRIKIQRTIEKASGINDDNFLKNFDAITVKPIVDECQSYIRNMELYGAEFKQLEAEYIVLCSDLHICPKKFAVSESDIAELKKEIARLEKELLEAREQEYIAEAIDEVMEEMGYTLIGRREVTKKSGKRFRDELYTFSEGTAVNIRYDSQGQIAMELGGIDRIDRLPSSSEALKLEGEMTTFCGRHTEFERRLAAKGIVCKSKIRHLPPTAEYAQIINTSDYDMKTEVETFKTERRSAKNESKKQHRNE